ncbi:MAG: DUF4010 domain-containing protein [Candidatus Micrarchaeota archaeon]|nr:DUF4010 domain-containing protein [Candidatus Micrarchaeota archaeon]
MDDFLLKTVLSIVIGGLIGLEREHTLRETVVGVRSFALLSFLGMLSVLIGFPLPAIGFAGVFFLAVAFYYFKVARFSKVIGITTAIMVPFVFVLGLLVGYGLFFEAGASAIVTAMMLAEKSKVHAAVRTLSRKEVVDGLILAIISFIVYPLLPAEPVAFAGQSLNLQYFWAVVILVSFITYAGHMLVKYYRAKAIAYAAFFGGLVSSLAVVSLFAKKVRRTEYGLLRFGFSSASAGAIAGDLMLLAVMGGSLLQHAFIPFSLILVAFLAFAFFYKKGVSQRALPVFQEPLSLKFALEFAVIYFIVRVVIGFLATDDSIGIFAFSFISGLISTTSVFASIASLYAAKAIAGPEAALAMMFAVFGSLAAKTSIMFLKLDRSLWPKVAPPVAAAVVLGIVGYWLQLTLGW